MKPNWPESWPLALLIAVAFFTLMYAAWSIERDTERQEQVRAESALRGK